MTENNPQQNSGDTESPKEKKPLTSPTLEKSPLPAIQDDASPIHNLLIGDNLSVLQALIDEGEAAYDVIYIDPPYNTGKNFIYNDKRYASKALRNPEYRHTSWREFMEPRLVLARELLADDGVIFVSIDDNEHARLKILMDKIFDERNFVANVVWQKSPSTRNDAKYFSTCHEYILVYHKGAWERNLLPRHDRLNARYKFDDNDGRGRYVGEAMSVRTYSARTHYPVTNPNTGNVHYPANKRSWAFTRERFDELAADNRIFWGSRGTSGPTVKKYLSEIQQGVVPSTWWGGKDVGTSTLGTKQLLSIFGGRVFDYTKPVDLIKKILQLHTKKDARVMDFFAGSGTTGQAVAELNAEDGGTRIATLVTNNESDIAVSVTYPRLKRILTGEDWADGKTHPNLHQGLVVRQITA